MEDCGQQTAVGHGQQTAVGTPASTSTLLDVTECTEQSPAGNNHSS